MRVDTDKSTSSVVIMMTDDVRSQKEGRWKKQYSWMKQFQEIRRMWALGKAHFKQGIDILEAIVKFLLNLQ